MTRDYSTRESVGEPRRPEWCASCAGDYSTRESVGEPRQDRTHDSNSLHYSTRESVGEPRLFLFLCALVVIIAPVSL